MCLLIYQVADYRSAADIRATWQNLLEMIHAEATEKDEAKPYEVIAERVRELGARLHMSESTFPIREFLPTSRRSA